MWKPYLKIVAKRASSAIHVLDRFHIMAYFSKAIDEVRADEARKLKQEGFEPVLKGSRWCWLKRPENLSSKQEATLSDLVQMNLKTVKSYLLKEDFQNFWEYKYAGSAAAFLDQWCFRAMRSTRGLSVRVRKVRMWWTWCRCKRPSGRPSAWLL